MTADEGNAGRVATFPGQGDICVLQGARGIQPLASDEVLAYLHFPEPHRRRLHSTNPLVWIRIEKLTS